MRQIFTLRLVATCVALLVLAAAVGPIATFISGLPDDEESIAEAASDGDGDVIARRIDLVETILTAAPSDDFAVDDGRTVGVLDLILDGDRVMRIAPGTIGQVDCDELDRASRCVVLADVLGDAVVWFAVLPQAPRRTVELPPVRDLDDGYALFDNGWQIRYAPVIERTCDPELDIVSFGDFLRRFRDGSTTILDLDTAEVNEVRCSAADGGPAPATSVPLDVELVDAPDGVAAR